MAYVLVLIALVLLGHGLAQRWRTRRQQLLRLAQWGPLKAELRRKTEWVTHPDGLGGQCFPIPRETRRLALSVAGLELWARSQSIGLPASVEDGIERVRADDFDRAFEPAFRIAARAGARGVRHAFSG